MTASQPIKRVDLHVHSHFSDGTLSPAEVVRRAAAHKVEIMALTDHDSISGVAEAQAEGEKLGLRVLCGIEINTCEGDLLHVLGYGIQPESQTLKSRLEQFRDRRHQRLGKILDRLHALSIDISWDDVGEVSKQTLGRPHVADAMVKKGVVRSRKEAFERFLMRGKPGYVEPMGPSAQEAIAAIREAGGWASLAHPGSINDEAGLKRLVDFGLEGLEVYYPTHNQGTISRLLMLAAAHRLIATVGSDFHGPKTGREAIGCMEIGSDVYEQLMKRL